jgi:hypothetical protein
MATRCQEYAAILKSYCIFGKDSPTYDIGRAMAAACGVEGQDDLFQKLVRLGVMAVDENIELIREGIPEAFPPAVSAKGRPDCRAPRPFRSWRPPARFDRFAPDDGRRPVDPGLRRRPEHPGAGDGYLIGVHIVDVAHHVKRGTSSTRRRCRGEVRSICRTTASRCCRRSPGGGCLQPQGRGSTAGHFHVHQSRSVRHYCIV